MEAVDEGSDERTKQRVQDGYSGKGNGEIYESRFSPVNILDGPLSVFHRATRIAMHGERSSRVMRGVRLLLKV